MSRTSHKLGIDANRPVVVGGPQQGALSPTVADPGIIADTGAGWVRINMVLGPWDGPLDTTQYQGRTWTETYDAIISGFLAKGRPVYGLIGHESVREDPGDRFRLPPEQLSPDAIRSADDWIRTYADIFVTIVRRYHDRVKVFESFNEPDDWRGADRNWIHPAWFAKMLHEIHGAVRRDPALDVKIVSGPLQGLEINQNAAAPYLRDTYREGKARFGWGQGVPYPFDGVGYHIYILEGFNADWPQHEAAVRQTYRRYVDDMLAVVRQAEGREKPIYLSEIGWFSNGGMEQFQAENLTLGMGLVAHDPAIALGIWFCTQDFGGDAEGKYYGLYRKGDLIPANRKPAYHAYKALCQSLAQEEQALFDNQTMINAFFAAAPDLGQGGWQMLVRAGLDHLVFARKEPYRGPAVEDLAALTDLEKAAVRRKLAELVPELERKRGWTTGYLNMRQGPGTGHSIVQVLPSETEVEVLGQEGDWLRVAALGQTGHVHGSFVLLEEDLAPRGFLRLRPELRQAVLEPPPEERLQIGAGMDWTTMVLARTWNRCGGLLAVLANQLRMDPAVAVAVFVVEAPRGQGFADDGRMIIRFENQIFYDRWGKWNRDRFAAHFQFDSEKRWQGHRWRPAPDQPWQEFHQDQAGEWQAFQFARTLDETAAMLSISMGAPQIMGFNHAAIGYESVQEMYEAFAASDREQIVGFFDFVKGPAASSPRLRALQGQDFASFAALYNGSGQVALYNDLLTQRYEAFSQLRAGGPAPPPGAPMGMLPPEMAPAMAPAAADEPAAPDAEREAWEERVNQAQTGMQGAFQRAMEMMVALAKANLRLYWGLLVMAGISFLFAMALALTGASPASVLIFVGLSVAAALLHLLSRPMRRLEQELTLVTQLQLINNTYWARLTHLRPGPDAGEEIQRIHQQSSQEMEAVITRAR